MFFVQELKFYSRIARNWKINPNYFNKVELDKYYESVEQLKKFEEVHNLVYQLSDVFWDFKCLYLKTSGETSTPNFWNRREVF